MPSHQGVLENPCSSSVGAVEDSLCGARDAGGVAILVDKSYWMKRNDGSLHPIDDAFDPMRSTPCWAEVITPGRIVEISFWDCKGSKELLVWSVHNFGFTPQFDEEG